MVYSALLFFSESLEFHNNLEVGPQTGTVLLKVVGFVARSRKFVYIHIQCIALAAM